MKKWFQKTFILTLLLVSVMVQAVWAAPKLSKTSLSMVAGKTASLKMTGASGKKVTWKSSNSKVVKITSSTNSKAVLSAKKAGTAKITATVNGKKKTCKVTVKAANANRKYIYSGHPGNDYVLEVMLKEAGVKDTMTDEEIVKRIYTWMGKRFIPTNDQAVRKKVAKGYKRKCYYNDEEMKADMQAFFKKTEVRRKNGELTYLSSYYTDLFDGKYSDYYGYGTDEEDEEQSDSAQTTFDPTAEDYLWYISEDYAYCWGDCITMSTTFTMLCKHAGIKAGWCHGLADKTSNHYWSWAVIDGKKYYFDLWLTGSYYFSTKKVSYAWFEIPRKTAKKLYIFKEEYES